MELLEKKSIGEGTDFHNFANSFVLVQKIKPHSIITTICFGIFVYLVFKTWIFALILILLGLLQILMTIKVTIKKTSPAIRKDLYFCTFRLYNYYNLIEIGNYEIVNFETGRGDGFTATSFDIGFFVDDKRFTLLAFGSKSTRDKLKELLIF